MSNDSVEKVLVTIDDAHLAKVQSVAAALRSAGMLVSNVMETTGIITGEIPTQSKQSLTSIPGVKAIEPDEEMRAI